MFQCSAIPGLFCIVYISRRKVYKISVEMRTRPSIRIHSQFIYPYIIVGVLHHISRRKVYEISLKMRTNPSIKIRSQFNLSYEHSYIIIGACGSS